MKRGSIFAGPKPLRSTSDGLLKILIGRCECGPLRERVHRTGYNQQIKLLHHRINTGKPAGGPSAAPSDIVVVAADPGNPMHIDTPPELF